MSVDRHEQYLGDGIYASFDGYTIWIRAPRESGYHIIVLEPKAISALLAFVEDIDRMREGVPPC